jgi:chromosome segregation ATPase
MEALKAIFGEKSLTYDELTAALKANENTIKLANLKDGEYVAKQKYSDLETELKNQIEGKTKELDEIKNKSNPNDELKQQIETLTTQKAELETKQAEASKQLNLLNKRELAREKTGIAHPDFLDLMINRHGEKSDDDFAKEVTTYAEANKDLWKPTGASPNLNGNPQGDDGDAKRQQRINEAMGIKENNT